MATPSSLTSTTAQLARSSSLTPVLLQWPSATSFVAISGQSAEQMDHLAEAIPFADSEDEDHAYVVLPVIPEDSDDDELTPTLPNPTPDPVTGQSNPQHFNIHGGGYPVSGSTHADGTKGGAGKGRGKKKREKFDHPPLNREPVEQCKKCMEFTRRGSNAYIECKTCLVCGTQYKTPKSQPLGSSTAQQACSHERYDHRGSTMSSRKYFCLDCGKTIAKPRAEAMIAEKVASKVAASSAPLVQVTGKVAAEKLISAGTATDVLNVFVAQAKQLIGSSDSVTTTQLHNLLADSVIACTTAKSAAESATSAMGSTAFMAMTSPDEYSSDGKRLVDPYEDEGIWAIPDGGCNASCHSVKWRENADAKLRADGYTTHWYHQKQKTFRGLGKNTTQCHGKRAWPVAVEVANGDHLVTELATSETEGSNPLLIGQDILKMWRIKIDYETGKAWTTFRGKEEDVELCRMRGSNLLLMNVSSMSAFNQQVALGQAKAEPRHIKYCLPSHPHYDIKQDLTLHRNPEEARQRDANVSDTYYGRDDPVSGRTHVCRGDPVKGRTHVPSEINVEDFLPSPSNDDTAYMAGNHYGKVKVTINEVELKGLEPGTKQKAEDRPKNCVNTWEDGADIEISSMGLRNFEQCGDGKSRGTPVDDFINSRLKGRTDQFRFTNLENANERRNNDMIVSSLRKNFPEYRHMTICLMDVRALSNPDGDTTLRKHIGRHPEIIKQIINAEGYKEHVELVDSLIAESTSPREAKTRWVVIFVCNAGQHRSEGCKEITVDNLTKQGLVAATRSISAPAWEHRPNCCFYKGKLCKHCTDPAGDDARKLVLETSYEIWDSAMEAGDPVSGHTAGSSRDKPKESRADSLKKKKSAKRGDKDSQAVPAVESRGRTSVDVVRPAARADDRRKEKRADRPITPPRKPKLVGSLATAQSKKKARKSETASASRPNEDPEPFYQVLQKLLDVFVPGASAWEYQAGHDNSMDACDALINEFDVPESCVERMMEIELNKGRDEPSPTEQNRGRSRSRKRNVPTRRSASDNPHQTSAPFRSRSSEVENLISHTPLQKENMWIDFEPTQMTNEELNALFEGKKRNFVTYVGGSETDRSERRVRVNGKGKGKGKGKFPVNRSSASLEDRKKKLQEHKNERIARVAVRLDTERETQNVNRKSIVTPLLLQTGAILAQVQIPI